jgi:sugar lactone lactonase YvrE
LNRLGPLLLVSLATGCGLSALGAGLLAVELTGKKSSTAPVPMPVTVITPATTVFDRVSVNYTLADPAIQAFDVKVEFSTNGTAGPFFPATEALGAPSQGAAGLSASSMGNPHVFVWNSFADLQPQGIVSSKATVIRVTALGSGGASSGYGQPGLSQPFALDNRLIATIAGSPSEDGEGIPEDAVPLVGPSAAVFAVDRSLLVADTGGSKVRRGDPTSKLVTTFAGSGTAGSAGDGGPASAAQLLTPRGVAIEATGAVLVTDTGNNRIRRVDPSTGIISTIAGIGTAGFTGDGGVATAARLSGPTGIAVDGAGTIYFCDTGNNAVRTIDTQGTIHTIAGTGMAGVAGDGGPAAQAQLSAPSGLCVSASGGIVFVADTGNHAVRRLVAGGSIVTVAGILGQQGLGPEKAAPGASKLNGPAGVALQGAALAIADTGNNRIRQVPLDATTLDVATGATIATIAGSLAGAPGFAGDNGPAAAALLDAPAGLAPDGAGGILVADQGNNRERRIDATGLIATVMGSGTPSATSVGDGGPASNAILTNVSQMAIGPDGSIYAVEIAGARVRRFTIGGTITTVAGSGATGFSGDGGPATAASFNNPFGLSIDSNGVIFVADTANAVIRAVNPVTGNITTIAGGGPGPDGVATMTSFICPVYLCSLPGANQLLTDDVGNEVIRRVSYGFDPVSGDVTGAVTDVVCGSYNTGPGYAGDGGPATSAVLACPSGLDVDSNGTIYFVDQFTAVVRKFTIGGNVSLVAGDPTNATPGTAENVPAATTTLAACRLAIDVKTNTIYVEEIAAGASRVRGFTDGGNINTVAGNGTAIADVTPGSPAAPAPVPVCLGVFGNMPDGTVLVASGGTRRILQCKPGGTIAPVAGVAPGKANGDGGPATAATVRQPTTAVATDGTVYVAEVDEGDVRRIDPKTGRISTAVGIGIRGLSGIGGPLAAATVDRIEGFTVDGSGGLILTQANESQVVGASFAQQTFSLVAGTGGNGTAPFGDGGPATMAQLNIPIDACFSPKTQAVYLTDQSHQLVRMIDANGTITTVAGGGTQTTDGVPALSAQLLTLTSITVDGNEVIYVCQTSTTDSLVRKFAIGGNIATVAGVAGQSGFNGDEIPANTALLNLPQGVAVDPLGNVYIADQLNHRVRRVDGAGFIATVAGTGVAGSGPDGVPATLSKLNGPRHVVLDGAGNIFVGEEFGNRVRRFRLFP